MNYKIIERKEILNEYAANLIGRFDRIIIKEKIKDESNPLSVISEQLCEIKDKIIGSGNETLEDLAIIEIQLNVFRDLLKKIDE